MYDFSMVGQPVFFQNIKKMIENRKISHAYLLESRRITNSKQIVAEFVKLLYSQYDTVWSHFEDASSLSLELMMAEGNLVIVEPVGSLIKKEQVLNIQETFSTTSFNHKPRIYIIYEADKLNKQAANSLLKFLEEPEENIIGILVTDNRYQVLETLRSRCQIFPFMSESFVLSSESLSFYRSMIHCLEEHRVQAIVYLPIFLKNEYLTRDKWLEHFHNLEYIYEQAIRKYSQVSYDRSTEELLDYICSIQEIESMLYKVKIIGQTINHLNYNLNINLMLDQFIIQFNGGDNRCQKL